MNLLRYFYLFAAFMLLSFSFLTAAELSSQRAFHLKQSLENSLQLSFELPAWELESSSKDADLGYKVKVADASYLDINEEESLPIFSTMIAIPYSGSVNMSIGGQSQRQQISTKLSFAQTLINEPN